VKAKFYKFWITI